MCAERGDGWCPLSEAGHDAVFEAADVTEDHAVEALVAFAVDTYGRLDWAANCAGVGGGHALTHEYPDDRWDRIVSINLRGTWLAMRREIEAMLVRADGGAIEYAPASIRVNAVCPGAIDTPMMDETFERFPGFRETLLGFVPMGRVGRPAEVATAIAWLCGRGSRRRDPRQHWPGPRARGPGRTHCRAPD